MTHRFDPTSLREYDIRGIVGTTLGAADATAIGRGFATCVRRAGGRRVAVGYDGRVSSPELEQALIEGLTASGVDVIRVGMGPTPKIGRAHGRTPVTNAHLVCRILLENKKTLNNHLHTVLYDFCRSPTYTS